MTRVHGTSARRLSLELLEGRLPLAGDLALTTIEQGLPAPLPKVVEVAGVAAAEAPMAVTLRPAAKRPFQTPAVTESAQEYQAQGVILADSNPPASLEFKRLTPRRSLTPLRVGEPTTLRSIPSPVLRDFDGDGARELGLFVDGSWLFDANHNGRWDPGDIWEDHGADDDKASEFRLHMSSSMPSQEWAHVRELPALGVVSQLSRLPSQHESPSVQDPVVKGTRTPSSGLR